MLIFIQITAIVVALALIIWGLSYVPVTNFFRVLITVLFAITAALWVLVVAGLIK